MLPAAVGIDPDFHISISGHCYHVQVMKYVKSCATNNTSELVRQCLSKLKKLDLDLTEGELVQIANHVPLFPVEIHLVSYGNVHNTSHS